MVTIKIKLLGIFMLILTVESFAQIGFEKGYFIDLNNLRTECLIRNYEWKNNPLDFDYKLSESDPIQKANVSQVREFGIADQSRYISADINIDRSKDDLSVLTYEKNPVWLRERQFLKVLIEGSASLLYYADGNLQRYFYQVNDTIRQLVHKKYLGENKELLINNNFRQQLWAEVRCGDVSERVLKQLRYNESDFIRYFKTYNECKGGEVVDYLPRKKKVSFHLKITPGINYSSMSITDYANTARNSRNADFDDFNFRIGLEAEFILPYNKNKWSLILEPNYQAFNSTTKFRSETFTATYNTIEFPLGLRYYSFLGPQSKLFLDGFIVSNFPVSSSIDVGYILDPTTNLEFGIAFGLGFSYKKISAEARFYKYGDLLNEYEYWDADYGRLSFIVGYRLF